MNAKTAFKEWDKLVGVITAPGYRDVSVMVRGVVTGEDREVNLKPADALELWRALGQMLDVAWRDSAGPIDAEPGERRPGDVGVWMAAAKGGAR